MYSICIVYVTVKENRPCTIDADNIDKYLVHTYVGDLRLDPKGFES